MQIRATELPCESTSQIRKQAFVVIAKETAAYVEAKHRGLPVLPPEAASFAAFQKSLYNKADAKTRPAPDEIELNAEAKQAIEVGAQKARRRGRVQPEHLLLGLLDQTEIRRLLTSIGVDPVAVKDAVRSQLNSRAGDSTQG